MHHIALIHGSDREGRFCDVVAGWALAQLRRHPEIRTEVIDPLALDLPRRTGHETAGLQRLRQQLASADAFIVVTPEYNHSFPAVLKAMVDSANEAWHAKPVGFVSYGGISGGLRAVEQLRLVFAELHAVTLRDSVAFSNAWNAFADGQPVAADAATRSFDRMVSRLKWWSTALRQAREQAPYEASA